MSSGHMQGAVDIPPTAEVPRARPADRRGRHRIGSFLAKNAIAVVFTAVFVAMCFGSDAFLSKANLMNIVEGNADVGIVACAATMVVIIGGLDISVGAIYALAGVISAKVAISSGVPVGIITGVLAGVAMGLFNGLVITVGKVNSFVATLATGIMFLSLAQVLSEAGLLTPTEASFVTLGRDTFLGAKWIVWIFALIALGTSLLLRKASFGRHASAIGSNPEAARLSGVPVQRVRCLTFALSGLAAGIAGVVLASQSGQADANVGGISFVLSVVAAVAVGGSSLRGGEGAVWRTVVGVLFLGLVTNGLHLLHVDPKYDAFFIGLLILVAAAAQTLGRRATHSV